MSRNGRDLTRRFPDLAAAAAQIEVPTLLLDGEIAVFDSRLLSRFEWLRSRPNEELVDDQRLLLPARRLAADGGETWVQVLERGYEGLVGKTRPRPAPKTGRSPGSGEGAALPRGLAGVGAESERA